MRIAWALLLVALGCAAPPGSAGRVALPRSGLGSPGMPGDGTIIDLTAKGRLRIGDAPHTLAQAGEAARGGPVLVRADGAASLRHLQMLLGELRLVGVGEVSLAVAGPEGDAAIPVPDDAFPMEDWCRDPGPAHASVVHLAVEPAPRSGLPSSVAITVCERLGDYPWDFPRTKEVVPWGAAFAARVGEAVQHVRHDLHLDPVGVVGTDSRLTVRGWVELLGQLAAAGLDRVLWPAWPEHAWTRARDPLPLPPRPCYVRSHSELLEDLTGRPLAPVLLPLAPNSQEDKDDDFDDRLIVSVDEDGRWFDGTDEVGLVGIRRLLRRAPAEHAERWRPLVWVATDDSPSGVPVSRLHVLLRADRSTRWREIEPFLEMLHEERFYRLQFAAAKFADLRYDAHETARHGVVHEALLPWPDSLEGKFSVWLRLEDRPVRPDQPVRHFSIERDADGWCRFLARGWVARDVGELRARMHDLERFSRAIVRVAPDVDMQSVLDLVDALYAHEVVHIDFERAR